MKRKLSSLLLILVVVCSFISCGKEKNNKGTESADGQEESIAQFFERLEKIEVGNTEMILKLDSGDSGQKTLPLAGTSIKVVTNQNDKEKKITQYDISYRLSDNEEYEPVTTVIHTDKTLYLEYSTLKKAGIELLSKLNMQQYLPVIGMLPDVQYVKIDEQTANQYLDSFTEGKITLPNVGQNEKNTDQIIHVMTKYIVERLERETASVSPNLLTKQKDSVKILVTKENLEASCNQILAMDLGAEYDGLVEQVKQVQGAEEYAKQLVTNKNNTLKGIKDGLNELKLEVANFEAFHFEWQTGLGNEEGKTKFNQQISVDIRDKEYGIKGSMTLTGIEGKYSEEAIRVPEKSTELSEIMKEISNKINVMK